MSARARPSSPQWPPSWPLRRDARRPSWRRRSCSPSSISRASSAGFGPLGVEVAALIGAQPARARAATLAAVADGRAAVVVGTHALFQESVEFRQLALVIVDEQHRFGVEQRRRLKQKGEGDARVPHQLIMTATPIPRTLAMTAYADLDCSVIGELPPGRQPVQTVVMPEQRRVELVERVAAQCAAGQAGLLGLPAHRGIRARRFARRERARAGARRSAAERRASA